MPFTDALTYPARQSRQARAAPKTGKSKRTFNKFLPVARRMRAKAAGIARQQAVDAAALANAIAKSGERTRKGTVAGGNPDAPYKAMPKETTTFDHPDRCAPPDRSQVVVVSQSGSSGSAGLPASSASPLPNTAPLTPSQRLEALRRRVRERERLAENRPDDIAHGNVLLSVSFVKDEQ